MLDGILSGGVPPEPGTALSFRRPNPHPDALALASRIADDALAITQEAGAIALADFRHGEQTRAEVWSKSGGSPVTAADLAVDAFLKARLGALMPSAQWLSEETIDDPVRLGAHAVWIVDPIDGTRAFMGGDADWAVSVALHVGDAPVLGILHAPAHGQTYVARAGTGAWRDGRRLAGSGRTSLEGARVAGPKGMLDALAEHVPGVIGAARVPSLALRIARVADGTLDATLVSRDARDWDIAAADLILTEAGGTVTTLMGTPPVYNLPLPRHEALVAGGLDLVPGLIDHARILART